MLRKIASRMSKVIYLRVLTKAQVRPSKLLDSFGQPVLVTIFLFQRYDSNFYFIKKVCYSEENIRKNILIGSIPSHITVVLSISFNRLPYGCSYSFGEHFCKMQTHPDNRAAKKKKKLINKILLLPTLQ